MVKSPVFKGSCTAIVTPFSEHGVDYERLRSNLSFQYENGSAAIVVCGTTGEAATLSPEEQQEMLRICVRDFGGKMKIIVGIGSNNTRAALRGAENAKAAGADAVLMVTPYYNKSTQRGLIEHFCTVADRVDLPLILYNVPSRTGIGLAAETCKTLSQHPNINGIKEASGDIALAGKILEMIRKKRLSAFDRRTAMRNCRTFKTVAEIQPVLDFLDDYGYIHPESGAVHTFGRPQLPKYAVNPRVLENCPPVRDSSEGE